MSWAKGEHDGGPIRWTALHEKESVEECCLAKPLVNIQDEAALVHQILAPLLQSLELPLPADWVVLAPSDPPAEPT